MLPFGVLHVLGVREKEMHVGVTGYESGKVVDQSHAKDFRLFPKAL